MSIFKKSGGCPACAHRFVAWRVWLISRWSCIRCPRCEARLIRRVDVQAYLVGLTGFVLLQPTMMFPLPLGWRIASVLAVFATLWTIDAATVRLVLVRRWRGFRGYDASDKSQ